MKKEPRFEAHQTILKPVEKLVHLPLNTPFVTEYGSLWHPRDTWATVLGVNSRKDVVVQVFKVRGATHVTEGPLRTIVTVDGKRWKVKKISKSGMWVKPLPADEYPYKTKLVFRSLDMNM